MVTSFYMINVIHASELLVPIRLCHVQGYALHYIDPIANGYVINVMQLRSNMINIMT